MAMRKLVDATWHGLRFAFAHIGLVILLSPAGVVWASGLQVTPVTLTIPSRQNAAALRLRNTASTPIHAQVRVYHWAQNSNGKDKLVPSQALVVSPPIFKLAPDKQQLVRVIRTGAPPTGVEGTYRLLISELPSQKQHAGVSFLVSYSVPVFVHSTDSSQTKPVLNWSLRRNSGQAQLTVQNLGVVHAQISALRVVDAAGKAHKLESGLGYVLAGDQRFWPLDAKLAAILTAGGKLQIEMGDETSTPTLLLPDAAAR